MQVSILCATRGEEGRDATGAGTGDQLAATRERELSAAATVLGIADVELLSFADGMLTWLEDRELELQVAERLVQNSPDVVVTFDEDGLYWHPDHIAIHK